MIPFIKTILAQFLLAVMFVFPVYAGHCVAPESYKESYYSALQNDKDEEDDFRGKDNLIKVYHLKKFSKLFTIVDFLLSYQLADAVLIKEISRQFFPNRHNFSLTNVLRC